MNALQGSPSYRLNPFQQVMALWEEVCPYNAGYVVQLRGRADFGALQGAIESSCQQMGLGKLVLDHEESSYHYEPVETIRLNQIQSADPVRETLCQILTQHMNAPLRHEPHHPIQWSVLNDSHTETHFLVLVWRHIAADAVSIRLLSRHVLARYYGALQIPSKGSLRVDPPDYIRVMKHHYRRLGYLKTLLRAFRLYLRLRYVYRLPELRERSQASRVLLFDAPPDLISRLVAVCKAREVSVNDAFLAALGSAIAEITPSRQAQQRRRSLALATAVDVRQVAAEDLSNCFGLFVGHWVTLIDNPDALSFEEMLEEVARQTRLEKSEQRYAAPQWDWRTVLFLQRWLSMKEDRAWYRKVYPLSAGLSNVQVNTSWFGAAKDQILAYFLVPPTGPALPLVVSPATLDDRLKLCAVYQEVFLNESQVRNLVALFLGKLESFSKISKAGNH